MSLGIEANTSNGQRYKQYYHPYFPIAPRRTFEADSLQYMATCEPHLLTAIITVAAKDIPQGESILRVCSGYMQQLVSEISAGKRCDVEAVEALLLLAEWEPQDSLSEGQEVGCGEENRAMWMHIGIALRTAYFLGLDRTAIKHEDEDKAAHSNRRRVTWAGIKIRVLDLNFANLDSVLYLGSFPVVKNWSCILVERTSCFGTHQLDLEASYY